MNSWSLIIISVLILSLKGVLVKASVTAATCTITAASNSAQNIAGDITFLQSSETDDVTVLIILSGFDSSDGQDSHGFHVHEVGSIGDNCADAGGHYNPHSHTHGSRTDNTRHVGDLGNIEESGSGVIETTFEDSVISLQGDYSIVGRSIVIHAVNDDFDSTSSSGNAGSRLGCCVINSSNAVLVNSVLLLFSICCAALKVLNVI